MSAINVSAFHAPYTGQGRQVMKAFRRIVLLGLLVALARGSGDLGSGFRRPRSAAVQGARSGSGSGRWPRWARWGDGPSTVSRVRWGDSCTVAAGGRHNYRPKGKQQGRRRERGVRGAAVVLSPRGGSTTAAPTAATATTTATISAPTAVSTTASPPTSSAIALSTGSTFAAPTAVPIGINQLRPVTVEPSGPVGSQFVAQNSPAADPRLDRVLDYLQRQMTAQAAAPPARPVPPPPPPGNTAAATGAGSSRSPRPYVKADPEGDGKLRIHIQNERHPQSARPAERAGRSEHPGRQRASQGKVSATLERRGHRQRPGGDPQVDRLRHAAAQGKFIFVGTPEEFNNIEQALDRDRHPGLPAELHHGRRAEGPDHSRC